MKAKQIKETRGRPKKYHFDKHLRRVNDSIVTFPSVRSGAMKFAKSKGWKFRTWIEDGMLNIVRVK